MFVRVLSAVLFTLVALPLASARAGSMTSAPLSHPAGFQSVTCHIINGGTKDVVVDSFIIEDVTSATSYGNIYAGICTGAGPWTLAPGRGCSRQLTAPSACNQPDACYCSASISGSSKTIRGSLVATVNASTTTLTSDLK